MYKKGKFFILSCTCCKKSNFSCKDLSLYYVNDLDKERYERDLVTLQYLPSDTHLIQHPNLISCED